MNLHLKMQMTSREVADLTGKRHKNVLADIEKMFENLSAAGLKSQPSEYLDTYKDSTGRTLKQYRLDKTLTMTLVTKYDDARRYAVTARWQELEETYVSKRELSIDELLEQSTKMLEKYRTEARDKTGKLLLASTLAAMLSDGRKGVKIKPSDVNEALVEMGLMEKHASYAAGSKRYFSTLTEKGAEFGRVGIDTPTARKQYHPPLNKNKG